jgi:antitoxin ParD1/3/4
MTSMNISLPESLRQYVESQVECGDWGTPGEYIRELVRQDRERRLAAVEDLLREGLSSPPFELSAEEVRARGLIAVLRDKVDQR